MCFIYAVFKFGFIVGVTALPEEINVMALPFLHGDVSFKAQFWTLCRAVNVNLPLLLLILRK